VARWLLPPGPLLFSRLLGVDSAPSLGFCKAWEKGTISGGWSVSGSGTQVLGEYCRVGWGSIPPTFGLGER
jgi:hypothetical protein